MSSLEALRARRAQLEEWSLATQRAGFMFRLTYGLVFVYYAVMGSGYQMAYALAGAAVSVWGLVILRCVLLVRLTRIDRTIAQRELDALEG